MRVKVTLRFLAQPSCILSLEMLFLEDAPSFRFRSCSSVCSVTLYPEKRGETNDFDYETTWGKQGVQPWASFFHLGVDGIVTH